MSGFEPGEGWRSVNVGDYVAHRAEKLVRTSADGGERYWIWAPVPPLPTEPCTVIRVTWGSEKSTDMWLTDAGTWCSQWGPYSRADMKGVVRFEVLAEPIPAGSAVYTSEQLNAILAGARSGTAKAVLDRVLHLPSWGDGIPISNIEALAREIGGES